MKNSMEKAIICSRQQYCTDCLIRKGCGKRITFYNEKQFFEELTQTSVLGNIHLTKEGVHSDMINTANVLFIEGIIKKRHKELQEHPTYSYN